MDDEIEETRVEMPNVARAERYLQRGTKALDTLTEIFKTLSESLYNTPRSAFDNGYLMARICPIWPNHPASDGDLRLGRSEVLVVASIPISFV